MERALVLGATNAVGCRLAEELVRSGAGVTAVVDDWAEAARLARLPVEMLDRPTDAALGRAMRACDVVFHCAERSLLWSGLGPRPDSALRRLWRRAFGDRGLDSSGNPAERTIEAGLAVALASGVGKVIALRAAQAPPPDETVLQSCRERGVAVTILRPATIYGPFCPFTIETVRALRANRPPRGGGGACIPVDRVVDAMLAAARNGPEESVVSLEDDQPGSVAALIDEHARAIGIARAASGQPPAPEVALTHTMASTAQWIEWARL